MAEPKKPIIGISPSLDNYGRIRSGFDYTYTQRFYSQAVKNVGGEPIILNVDLSPERAVELCDGIILAGGEDMDTQLYGEEDLNLPGALHEPLDRSTWERRLLRFCDQANLPVLGICYGMQMLNVHYGGTLYQDIPRMVEDNIGHSMTTHQVVFQENFLGYAAGTKLTTNSRHHQAIKQIAPSWQVCAQTADGIIEAITNGQHFGIQWHPESDETGYHIYRAFLERCMA